MARPNIVFGTGLFGVYEDSYFNTSEKVQAAFDVLRKHEISTIDSSRHYPTAASGTCEQLLGEAGVTSFTVDTKVWSMPGKHTPDELQKSIDESLAALGVSKVHILYLHCPDPETPLEDICKGMNAIHAQGKFERFGLSNHSISDIKEMLEICTRNNWVKPSVYQGAYNALSRIPEKALIPLLHANNMSMYSYWSAAGGAFSNTSSRMADQGRIGQLFRAQYGHPAAMEAIAKVSEVAEKHGITGHAVALRWMLHHSALSADHGDAMVISASSEQQLDTTLTACQAGPLPAEIVDLMEQSWEVIEPNAPPYSIFVKDEGDLKSIGQAFAKS